ncbi:MAG: hypothetical protein EBY62_13530 [Cellvibrionales bacterium]|nr:hypothetical protein [Cellvibrionales bacterium]
MVNPVAPAVYSIHDATTGARLGMINIPGILITGPIISGDTCSITTSMNNTRVTHVVRLPSGHIINKFFN